MLRAARDDDTGCDGLALTFGCEQYGGVAVQVGDVLFRPAEGDFRVWEKRRNSVLCSLLPLWPPTLTERQTEASEEMGWGRSVQQALPGSPESQHPSFRDTAAYAGP